MEDGEPGTRGKREGRDCRQVILQAAARVFARRGYAATSMADIAADVCLRSARGSRRRGVREAACALLAIGVYFEAAMGDLNGAVAIVSGAVTTHALAIAYGFTDIDGRLPVEPPWQPGP